MNSQWRKVQDRLEDDERCSRLEKIDRLEIFQVSARLWLFLLTETLCLYLMLCQEYIRDLEREEEEQRKIQKVLIGTHFFFIA